MKVDLSLLSGVFWGMGTVALRRYPEVDYKNATMAQYVCGSLITGTAILVLGTDMLDMATTGKAALMGAVFGILVFMSTFPMIIRIMQICRRAGLVSLCCQRLLWP